MRTIDPLRSLRSFLRSGEQTIFGSLRGRLILGLLPGLLALLTLLAIGLFATDILIQANKHMADVGWELNISRSLQIKLQQAMIPLNDFIADHPVVESPKQFRQLADDLDQLLAEAQAYYGESDEQAAFVQAVADWQTIRQRAELLFSMTDRTLNQDQRYFIAADIQTASQSAWASLELLNNAVFEEMQRTVEAGESAHDTASQLLIISSLVAFVAGLIFVFLFSRHITRPIHALAVGAARIGSGDLAFRLTLERRDEVGALAQAFDRMGERLQDAYQHLEERVSERTAQLRTLHEASRSVVGELEIDAVLQTIADLARSLGNAEYAAVLVPRTVTTEPPRFFVSHDPDVRLAPPISPPHGRGLLGLLLTAQMPVRVDSLAQHPAALGFPPGHFPMQNFLGIPVRVHERSVGGLYLTNKRVGHFDDEDEELLSMLAAYAGIAIENARLYAELTSMNQMLEERVQERTAELAAVSAERARYALQLRQVLNRTVRIQEEERKRIAKDIHDGVSQWLMGALFEMQAARVRLPDELTEVVQHLSEAQRVLKEVKSEMRRVIYDLHPPLLESNGLVAALRGHINETQTHSHVVCHFQVSGEERRLPPDQALALFRIAQEAMHNVMRHAQVDRLDVSLVYVPDSVQLTVADEGGGFAPDVVRQEDELPHWGLLGMEERATAVGASLRINSAPGQGTRVSVLLPTPGNNGTGDHAAEESVPSGLQAAPRSL